MVAHALRLLGAPVARVTTLGLFLDDERLDLPKTYDGFIETMARCRARGGRHAAIELTSEALAAGFARAWPCVVGVFTNLTHDHLNAHGTFEHYLASKAQLFVQLPQDGTAVLNGCDESCQLVAEVVPKGVRILWYGVPSRGAATCALDARAKTVNVHWGGTRIELDSSLADAPCTLETRGIGEVFAENALAAWLGAVAAGVPPGAAATAIAEAPIPAGRFEVVLDSPRVVVDYAHTPDALARTLGTARSLCHGDVIVVFGAGGNRDRAKRTPMGVAARSADRVLLTSDNPRDEDPLEIARTIQAGLADHRRVEIELDRAAAIARAIDSASPDDVIVIAGKGHEVEQITGRSGDPRSFSDADVVRAHREHRHA